jgi:hypothetical protein
LDPQVPNLPALLLLPLLLLPLLLLPLLAVRLVPSGGTRGQTPPSWASRLQSTAFPAGIPALACLPD